LGTTSELTAIIPPDEVVRLRARELVSVIAGAPVACVRDAREQIPTTLGVVCPPVPGIRVLEQAAVETIATGVTSRGTSGATSNGRGFGAGFVLGTCRDVRARVFGFYLAARSGRRLR